MPCGITPELRGATRQQEEPGDSGKTETEARAVSEVRRCACFRAPSSSRAVRLREPPGYDTPRVTAQTCLLQGASAAKSPKPLGYLLFPVSFLQPFKHRQLSSPGPPEANRPKTDMGGCGIVYRERPAASSVCEALFAKVRGLSGPHLPSGA